MQTLQTRGAERWMVRHQAGGGHRSSAQRKALEVLVAATDDAIYTKDLDGTYLTINPAGAAVLGKTPGQVLGQTDFELMSEGDAVRATESDERVVRSGALIRYEDHRGDRVWLSTKGVLRDDDGEAFGIFGISRDVTELWKSRAVERALIGIVAHDLKSPLAALTLNTTLLATFEPGEGMRRVVSRIARSVRQMNELVLGVLDVARVRSGVPLPIIPARVDLFDLCKRAADLSAEVHPGRALELTAEGECVGAWDEHRLLQALTNLVTNAVKYGDPAAPVRISCRQRGDEITVEVNNQGKPISAELLPNVFEPFRRGAIDCDGTGLGLYIVREVARAHQGKVEVASSDALGTTFALTLPVGRNLPKA